MFQWALKHPGELRVPRSPLFSRLHHQAGEEAYAHRHAWRLTAPPTGAGLFGKLFTFLCETKKPIIFFNYCTAYALFFFPFCIFAALRKATNSGCGERGRD